MAQPRDTQPGAAISCNYAIVGGGVSGVYVAWRLAKEDYEDVRIFEASPRIGGRLLSVPVIGTEFKGKRFNAELGGMRFTKNHVLISSLARTLGLGQRPFDYETNTMFLRGRRLKSSEEKPAKCATCKVWIDCPYALSEAEFNSIEQAADAKKKSIAAIAPSALIRLAISRAFAELDLQLPHTQTKSRIKSELDAFTVTSTTLPALNASDWSLVGRRGFIFLERVPLADSQRVSLANVGFWNLLYKYLSPEGFHLVHDGLGYESVVANWNAAEAIPWFLEDLSADYLTLPDGMESLPRSLSKDFEQRRDRSFVHCEHTLVELSQTNDDPPTFNLLFERTLGEELIDHVVCNAKHVILALPKQALQSIRLAHDFADINEVSVWRTRLDSVSAHGLFKLFLGYDEPWWKEAQYLGGPSGRIITDLPIRQAYFFETPTKPARGVIMTYSDEHYIDFWKPLLHRKRNDYFYKGREPIKNETELEKNEELNLIYFGASRRSVLETHEQLLRLYPGTTGKDSPAPPLPYVGYAKDWSGEEGLWGWHSWNPSHRSWDVIRAMKRPFKLKNVYVCGEAYSCEQGWVEGALRSAELVLKEIGVRRPDWVNQDLLSERNYDDFYEYIGIGEMEIFQSA